MIRNVAVTASALVFIASSVFAQSLADAKKAIDAEQYQKAKSMLKNLTVTQPTKDENFFYLGWVYIIQEETDSAKVIFNQGIAANPKSAINYAGLGVVARLEKDQSSAKLNFDKAAQYAGKDSKPYVYTAKGYLLAPVDFNTAVTILQKAKTVNAKDAEVSIVLGDAYRSQLNSSVAYTNYQDALGLDPKSPIANVSIGILWRLTNNYSGSEDKFKEALVIDPNFGPAYREWAETDLRWAQNEPKEASAKVKEALDHYQKFLSLTDMSVESRLRYMAFLINAGDYKTLQTEAAALSQYKNSNLRVYRFLGWAAYENKDYAAGLTALTKFMSEAGDKRIIPADYVYLGHLQLALDKDSLAEISLKKAYELDSTRTDVFKEIAEKAYKAGKFTVAAEAYKTFGQKSRSATLNDHFKEGMSYYKAFTTARSSKAIPKPALDTSLLVKADSAFTYVQRKRPTPIPLIVYYQARENEMREPANNTNPALALAKPFWEQYVAITVAAGPIKDADKSLLTEAYVYLGRYYEFLSKDDAKAEENFAKAKELDPTDANVTYYYQTKAAASKSK